jgi:hypothetical protein
VSVPAAPAGDVKYLLSLQVLLDLCGTADNPARAWAQPVPTAQLRLSVLTVALARAVVNGIAVAPDRERLAARLLDLLAKLKADGGPPLPFIENAATTWQSFMHEPTLGEMAQIDRQFYAVASSEGLCVVEYQHPYSAALGPLGIKVHGLGKRP